MARLYRTTGGRYEIREAHRKARPRRWPVSPDALEYMRRYGVRLGEPVPYVSEQLIGHLIDAGLIPHTRTVEPSRFQVAEETSRRSTTERAIGRTPRSLAPLPAARARDHRAQSSHPPVGRRAQIAPQAASMRTRPQWLLIKKAPMTWSIEPRHGRRVPDEGPSQSFIIGGSLSIDHPKQLSAAAGRGDGLHPRGSLFLIADDSGMLQKLGTHVLLDRDYFLIIQARSRQDLTVREFEVVIPPGLNPAFIGRCGAWNVYRVRTPVAWDARTRGWLTTIGYQL